eukprot:SAG31_NODE_932_length_10913_cov_3.933235_14_plen_30_part_00
MQLPVAFRTVDAALDTGTGADWSVPVATV